MKNKNINILKIVYLLVLFFCFVFFYFSTGIYYGINDDITMQKIVSGYYSIGPDGHSVFIRYALGGILAFLFRLCPVIDWYGLFMLSVLYICYGCLGIRIAKLTENLRFRIGIRLAAAVCLFVLLYDTTIFFQFTMVAGVLAATASFLFLTEPKLPGIKAYIVIGIMYILADTIRHKVFLMFAPVMVLILLWRFLRLNMKMGQELISKILSYVLCIMALLAMAFFIEEVEDAAYSSPEWSSYRDFKSYRAQIVDYYGWPSYEGNEYFWDELEISREEYECLDTFGLLPDIDTYKFGRIAEFGKQIHQGSDLSWRIARMKEMLMLAIGYETNREQNLLVLMSVLLVIYVLIRGDILKRLLAIGGVLGYAAILLYLLYVDRIPDRIVSIYDIGWIMFISAVTFMCMSERQSGDAQNTRTGYIICCLTLCAMIPFVSITIRSTLESVEKMNELKAVYEEWGDYQVEHSDYVFVTAPGTVSSVKQFSLIDDKTRRRSVGTRGWSAKSPFIEETQRSFGLDPEGYILTEDGVVFATADLEDAEPINEYYKSIGVVDGDYQIIDECKLSNGKTISILEW